MATQHVFCSPYNSTVIIISTPLCHHFSINVGEIDRHFPNGVSANPVVPQKVFEDSARTSKIAQCTFEYLYDFTYKMLLNISNIF